MAPGYGTVLHDMQIKKEQSKDNPERWEREVVASEIERSPEDLLMQLHLRQTWEEVKLLVTGMPGEKDPGQSQLPVQRA